MNPEYQAMAERHKREREALRMKQKKEFSDMKIRHEIEKLKLRQQRYVKNLSEWCEWMEAAGQAQGPLQPE